MGSQIPWPNLTNDGQAAATRETPQVGGLPIGGRPEDSDTAVRLDGWPSRETARQPPGHSVAVGHGQRDPTGRGSAFLPFSQTNSPPLPPGSLGGEIVQQAPTQPIVARLWVHWGGYRRVRGLTGVWGDRLIEAGMSKAEATRNAPKVKVPSAYALTAIFRSHRDRPFRGPWRDEEVPPPPLGGGALGWRGERRWVPPGDAEYRTGQLHTFEVASKS